MSCPYGTRSYLEYLLDEMEAASRGAFDAHLGECASCRNELQAYARLIRGLRALPERNPPPDLAESIMARIYPPSFAIRRRREAVWGRIAQIVAAHALAISFLLAGSRLAGRAVEVAWGVLSAAGAELAPAGRSALVLLVSLAKVASLLARPFSALGRALGDASLLSEVVPPGSPLLLAGFICLSAVLLWRLVAHPISRAPGEVRHVH